MYEILRELLESRVGQFLSRRYRVIVPLALLVVFATTYMLMLPAATQTTKTYCGKEEHEHSDECYTVEKVLACGKEESEGHTHTDDCYSVSKELVCGKEESSGHSHSSSCYDDEGNLTCGKEESSGHTHTSSCYKETKTLVCGKEESSGHTHTDACYKEEKTLTCKLEEHTHTEACYSNPDADVESASTWENSVKGVKLTGDWAKDLIAIAKTQLGYHESTENYIINDSGDKKGYTRYGAWYGDEYGDWCAMFVSFCLHYADIGTKYMPEEASCQAWVHDLKDMGLYHSASEVTSGDYALKSGDLIFFDWHNDSTSDHVGIIYNVKEDSDGNITGFTTIEGNSSDQVEINSYSASSGKIKGYGELPENPAMKDDSESAEDKTEAELESEAEEETEETEEQESFKLTAQAKDGMKVTVSGKTEALPEATEEVAVSVTKLSDKEAEELAKSAGVDTEENQVYAYDVSLMNGEDEIEPEDTVTVTFKKDDIGNTNDTSVYHFEDSSDKSEKMELKSVKDGVVKFETDSFSKYLVVEGGVTYDSDLMDFLTGAMITDYAGNVINNGDTIYIGQDYTITMSFAESNTSSNQKQFHYDTDGYLTYQIDTTNLILKEVDNAPITLDNGTVVGHYWLSTDGTLKVQFDHVDNDGTAITKTYFDEYMNTVFKLTFDATVKASEAGTDITIPFSDDIDFTGKVNAGGDLNIEKTAGNANNAKHSMDFTVKVTCTTGVVSNITLTDSPKSIYNRTDYEATIDTSSISFTDLEGNALEEEPTIVENEDGTYTITYPASLQAGEGFLIKYYVIADENIYKDMVKNNRESGDYRIAGNVNYNNTIEVTGDNGTSTPVDKSVTVEKTSWTSLMSKTHSDTTIQDSNKNDINVIQWIVSIGDGYANIGGNTVTDTIGSALSFLTTSGTFDYINVWAKHADGSATTYKYYFDKTRVLKTNEFYIDSLSEDGKTVRFVLPDDCVDCNITYYTTYTEGDETENAYKNTASISVDGYGEGQAYNTSSAGSGIPGIEKTVVNADADYIYYQIKVDVPKSMYGQYVSIMDRGIDTNTGGISFGCKMDLCKDFTVTVQKASDSQPVEYQYSSSPAAGTYNWAGQDGNNYWSLWLNSETSSTDQKWPIDEDSTLTITFAYPRDVQSEGKTMNQVLWQGYYARNEARVYYVSSGTYKRDYAIYYSTPEMMKTGYKMTDGDMSYTVEYATYETNNTTNTRSAAISTPFSDAYLYDQYDSQLEFRDDYGIECLAYNVKTKKYAYFWIDPEDITVNDSESSLTAYWKNFKAENDYADLGVTEGDDLETFLNGQDLANYQLYFYYYMRPTQEAVQASSDSLKISNTAKIGYKGTDSEGNPFDYLSPGKTFNYTYTTDILDKTGTQAVAGGNEINYTIGVNSNALDLSDGNSFEVEDQMSDNMSLYLDSIVFTNASWTQFTVTNKTTKDEFVAAFAKAYPAYASEAESVWEEEIEPFQENCKVVYDEANHKIVFTVPDECSVKITYTTKINETGSSVTVKNTATIKGATSKSSGVEKQYEVNDTSGSASGSKKYLYVLKQNSTNQKPVIGAKIALYGDTDKEVSAPDGVDQTMTVNGKTLYYYGTFESAENDDNTLDGTFKLTDDYLADGGLYALKEIAAPDHYQISTEAIPFYWEIKNVQKKDGIQVKSNRDTLIFENTPESYALPKTGGSGTILYTMSGFVLVVSALGIGLLRWRRRERRFRL